MSVASISISCSDNIEPELKVYGKLAEIPVNPIG
jgi:hypothetical protein